MYLISLESCDIDLSNGICYMLVAILYPEIWPDQCKPTKHLNGFDTHCRCLACHSEGRGWGKVRVTCKKKRLVQRAQQAAAGQQSHVSTLNMKDYSFFEAHFVAWPVPHSWACLQPGPPPHSRHANPSSTV